MTPEPVRSVAAFMLWSPRHNNVRYAILAPRLAEDCLRLRRYVLNRHRWIHALEFRMWNLIRSRVYQRIIPSFAHGHRALWTVDLHQIPFWPRSGSVVVDLDDPAYTPEERFLLGLRQVSVVVVTTARAKDHLVRRGVQTKIQIIPQPVDLRAVDEAAVARIRARYADPNEIVVGVIAPTFTVMRDGPRRWRNGLDDLDALLAAFLVARREDPRLCLWLIGHPSRGVRSLAREVPWLRLLGYVPFEETLNYVAAFDIAGYPRRQVVPPGRFNYKLAQFMGAGRPVVAIGVEEAEILAEVGCGVLCHREEELAGQIARMARDSTMRGELGAAGRAFAERHLAVDRVLREYSQLLRAH